MLEKPREVYSVSRLNSEIRSMLEQSFPLIWVEGEVSNLSMPRSGHCYFSLKDEHAHVRCALFKGVRQRLRFKPTDGARIVVRARISLYEPRGDFQLLIEHIEPQGEGELQRQFLALKARLAAQGLFDAKRKRPLPTFPRCLGIITSPTGAALRDILHVLKRRYPTLPIIVYPSSVQGHAASNELLRALHHAQNDAQCDVLILTRGGGSLEDLWAFNDERLAHAIAESTIPIVSAVGHEIDFTIADFVADLRAPTPSAAAELVSPDRHVLTRQLEKQGQRLLHAQRQYLHGLKLHLHHVQQRLSLIHPRRRIEYQQQHLDDVSMRLERAIRHLIRHHRQRLTVLQERLNTQSPRHHLQRQHLHLQHLRQNLATTIHKYLQEKRSQLTLHAQSLHNLSPLQTLARGYSLTLDAQTGRILTHSKAIAPGSLIESRLAHGRLLSRVIESND